MHPDLNVHLLDAEKTEEMTAYNNEAYHTLSKETYLFPYLLGLHGVQLSHLTLTPEFLGEMMDINEEIAEIRLEQDTAAISKMAEELENKKKALRLEVQAALDDYDKGLWDNSLSQIAQYCLKSNYLRRLTNNLTGQPEL